MKKIFSFLLLTMFLTTTSSAFSQVSFGSQPDPSTGKDAIISSTNPTTYYGSNPELVIKAWGTDIMRSLIQFDLSAIPTNVGIESATIFLSGSSSSVMTPSGNSCPPIGSTTSNPLWVERITQNWQESTVDWNNQPLTDITDRAVITQSTSNFDWYYYIPNSYSLINMVQNMVTNPSNNNGFMLKLQNENGSRNTFFESSDYSGPNPEKFRPSIRVTYSIPEFTYCFNSSNSQEYTFTSGFYASDHCSHIWTIDGTQVSEDPYFTLTLSSGTHQVCHTITYLGYYHEYTTSKCITICVY